MAGATANRPKLYLLPLSVTEKARLVALCDAAGVTMADALREGAAVYLVDRLIDQGDETALARAPEVAA